MKEVDKPKDIQEIEGILEQCKAYAHKVWQNRHDNFTHQKEGQKNGNTSVWDMYWYAQMLATVKTMGERIQALANGEMQVFDKNIEPRMFWQRIMDTVETEIWTTNIASQKSLGKQQAEVLLSKQRGAVARGVTISRVFVYDEENRADFIELRNVMGNQLMQGIKVYAIESKTFRAKATAFGFKPSTDDFMLIDERFVYETNFVESDEAYRNRFWDDPSRYEQMKKIADAVMRVAVEVLTENISQFPNIY